MKVTKGDLVSRRGGYYNLYTAYSLFSSGIISLGSMAIKLLQ